MLKHIPNILTLSRFILIPFIVYFSFNTYIISIILIGISIITDILDGYTARKFNLVSDYGKLLDPLADKFTQISILIALVLQSILPLWILIVMLIKELALVIGAIFLYNKKLVVSSNWYGKVTTFLIYTAIIVSMIAKQLNILFLNGIYKLLYYLALISTLISFILYTREFFVNKFLKNKVQIQS